MVCRTFGCLGFPLAFLACSELLPASRHHFNRSVGCSYGLSQCDTRSSFQSFARSLATACLIPLPESAGRNMKRRHGVSIPLIGCPSKAVCDGTFTLIRATRSKTGTELFSRPPKSQSSDGFQDFNSLPIQRQITPPTNRPAVIRSTYCEPRKAKLQAPMQPKTATTSR